MRFRGSIEIDRPVAEVFAFMTHPENETKWQSALVEHVQTSEGALGVGTRGRRLEKFLGMRRESSWEITEFEPNGCIGITERSSTDTITGGYTFIPSGNGTVVAYDWDMQAGAIRGLMLVLGGPLFRRLLRGDFRRLKELIESDPSS